MWTHSGFSVVGWSRLSLALAGRMVSSGTQTRNGGRKAPPVSPVPLLHLPSVTRAAPLPSLSLAWIAGDLRVWAKVIQPVRKVLDEPLTAG